MIPILYPKTETEFTSNGLGALFDVSECSVKEERNGVYELEMQYPVVGIHFNDIELDSLIFAIPSDGEDPQPFQVYNISTPINGTVTINAQHISYRLSFVPIAPTSAVGAADALNSIKQSQIEESGFDVYTDISNTTTKFSRIVPSSFRECIGGTEGSFIDMFGGEIKWDRFTVNLYAHRGTDTGVRIGYSKNISDFTNTESNDNLITAVYPYWYNEETGKMITCGTVYAIKDFKYIKLEDQETPPEWIDNKYYRIKTEGYYKLDEDYVPIWITDKYYFKKPDGYYRIESETAPIFEAGKYYWPQLSGFQYVDKPSDTTLDWQSDTYFSLQDVKLFRSTKTYAVGEYVTNPIDPANKFVAVYRCKEAITTAGDWNPNKWEAVPYDAEPYDNTKTYNIGDWVTYGTYACRCIEQILTPEDFSEYKWEVAPDYELITYKPYDWDENWTEKDVTYYTYIPTSYAGPIDQEPSDWSTTYKNYFTKYEADPNNPEYILTTTEPLDWYDDDLSDPAGLKCNSYYEYYIPDQATPQYVVTTSEPEDWSTDYTNYYIYEETRTADDQAFQRTLTLDVSSEFQYEPTVRMLSRYGSSYLKASNDVENAKTLDISFIALWQTEEYKNIAPLERVNLCDTVTVELPNQNGLLEQHKFKVIETDFDVVAERYKSIKLGNTYKSLPNTIGSIGESIKSAMADTMSILEQSIAYQVDRLNGALGGNIIFRYNGENQPSEMIIGDTNDISSMQHCLRINYRGIGFSNNGYDGPYTSIWGLDGEFDGQCIKAGSILGSSIKADTLEASVFKSTARDELLQDANEKITDLQSQIDALNDLSGWLEVRDGNLYIGKGDSPIMLVATNEELAFINADTNEKLAYIQYNVFYAPNIAVQNRMLLGNYLVSSTNDGLAFIWNDLTSNE